MAGRSIVALVSLVLLAAGVLFQFFVILSGAVGGQPEPKFFFLSADTSNIPGAAPVTAWTYFSICGFNGPSSSNGETVNCGPASAAPPFDLVRNFGSSGDVPASSSQYYYLSRTAWAFYIIALFFSVLALFGGLLALCTRLGSYLSGALSLLAFFFQALSAALMTAWTVKGRNAFRSVGREANLGRYSYGFTWAAVVAFFLSLVLFCVAGGMGKDKTYSKPSRFGRFGRKRGSRRRGSFGDSAVKDEYS